MKILLFLLVSHSVLSLTIEFYGPCSNEPLLVESVSLDSKVSVGQITTKVLDDRQVDYKGSVNHLQSAFGTPYGIDAMEVISDSEMRSHGWCYDVNSRTSSLYPGQKFVTNDDHIEWYFCYVAYDSGVWSNSHERTYLIRPKQFCKE